MSTQTQLVPYSFPDTLWTPQLRGLLETTKLLSEGKSVCLYGPTGSGKSRKAVELLKWAQHSGIPGIFYVNRKLLIGQTHVQMIEGGLNCGIRAADYEDYYDFEAPVQIASTDTERSRVFNSDPRKNCWEPHPAGLVIVDEIHIQKSETMRMILDHYKSKGAMIVGLTATPVGLGDWMDEIVISGRMQEYRDCGALVPAIVRSIEQPDLSKVKRNATGEFILDGKKKQIYTQSIVGNVIAKYKEHNPDARPTMLFAPGKPESVWFCEQFEQAGFPWCHVDATDAVLHGKRYTLTRPVWEDIQGQYIDGKIKGLCARFKLREGVNFPSTYMGILATPIGSLASYIQTVGRILRRSPETPTEVQLHDHGGNVLRHGSPNIDRDWKRWWHLPEHAVSAWHLDQIRDGKEQEPICCPKCHMERRTGIVCPGCGHTHEKSKRHVRMEDGRLVEIEGDMIPERKVRLRPDTEKKWTSMYYGFAKKKVERSFNQLYAFFQHEYRYSPPRDLPFMPKRAEHWYLRVCDVDRKHLHTTETSREAQARKDNTGNK